MPVQGEAEPAEVFLVQGGLARRVHPVPAADLGQAREPRPDMVPVSTWASWGSSSRLKVRKNRPVGVTRPSRAMLRNLYRVNGAPSRPIRVWRKSTGSPGPDSFTAAAITAMGTAPRTSPSAARHRSSARFTGRYRRWDAVRPPGADRWVVCCLWAKGCVLFFVGMIHKLYRTGTGPVNKAPPRLDKGGPGRYTGENREGVWI